MPVAEAQQRISSLELSEWMAYASLEPFEDVRADARTAFLMTMIANTNRAKGQRALQPKDFLPLFQDAEDEEQVMGPDLSEKWRGIAGALGFERVDDEE